MFKKKLLVIVGAGASVEFGMPSVKDLDGTLAREVGTRFALADDAMRNLYSWLSDEVTAYWGRDAKPSQRKTPNFEDLMYAAPPEFDQQIAPPPAGTAFREIWMPYSGLPSASRSFNSPSPSSRMEASIFDRSPTIKVLGTALKMPGELTLRAFPKQMQRVVGVAEPRLG
jgi:hypothetical protein